MTDKKKWYFNFYHTFKNYEWYILPLLSVRIYHDYVNITIGWLSFQGQFSWDSLEEDEIFF